MLYKFSPTYITSLTNAILYVQLEQCITLVNYNTNAFYREHLTRIALYSIDCVRKLLFNYHFHNEFIFEQLDEARTSEIKENLDFWKISQEVNFIFQFKIEIEMI